MQFLSLERVRAETPGATRLQEYCGACKVLPQVEQRSPCHTPGQSGMFPSQETPFAAPPAAVELNAAAVTELLHPPGLPTWHLHCGAGPSLKLAQHQNILFSPAE